MVQLVRVLLGLLVTIAATGAHADEALANPATTPTGIRRASADGVAAYMPDRVLVRLKAASSSRARLQSGTTSSGASFGIASLNTVSAQVGAISVAPAIETAQNSSVASALGLDNWVLVELAPGSDVKAAVAAYRADPNVEAAEPDYLFQPLVAPTDPYYSMTWGHNNTGQFRAFNPATNSHTGSFVGTVGFDTNAEAGWTGPNGFGLPSVIIAILDTGVDLAHPDLRVVSGYDTGDNDPDPQDDSATPGHGTACAGVAAAKANNGLGSCGSAPGCSIMPIKVTNDLGFFSFSWVASGIVWASDHGADVISMSFGFYFPPEEASAMVNAALDYADAAGVVMFSGTGNANNGLMLYPASHPKVISVGGASPCGGRKRSASNPALLAPGVSPDPNNFSCDGVRWWGSSWGTDTKDAPDAVDILAPTLIPFTDIHGGAGYAPGDYAFYFNGVSCSAPYAAGVAALIKSKHPDWTAAQIRQQLVSTAQDVVNVESGAGWDKYSGYGMVDINAAAGCSAIPAIAGLGSITVSAGEGCCAMIRPADLVSSVTDPDGAEDIVSVRVTRVDGTDMNVDSTLVCGLGSHSVRVTVTDYCGNTSSALVDVNVADTTPPSLAVVMDRNALWPPNHKLVPCCASITATDHCDADPDVALVSVVSNEPDNVTGDAVGDIRGAEVGTDDRCFDLRSERLGVESARRYTIVYSATDASGNVAYDTVEVHVPHDQSAAALASSGFTANGTRLDADAAGFALVVTGTATLDVRRIDTMNLYVGNTASVTKASGTRIVDVNSDQKADLAVFFEVSQAENVTAPDGDDAAPVRVFDGERGAQIISDGPIGMHFTLEDGTGYLVHDIYALGAPVAMPSIKGKNTITGGLQEVTATTDPAAEVQTAARLTALTSIQPNPFKPQTTVHFSLPKSERVRIAIHDVTGALVRQLVDETLPAGQHQARWDARSDRGTGVTSGVYFVRMMAGSYREVRKIVMLK